MTPSPVTDSERSVADRGRRFWFVAIAVCIVALTGVNGYRAATQSITHDEAVTYGRYVKGPFYRLVVSSDANNHILHSLLCRLSVGLFDVTEFTLRLPSVAGGLLFMTMIARVGWRTWGPSAMTLAAVLVMGLNPFVMDYLSIARGYSLALGLWVAALDQLLAAVSSGASNEVGVEARRGSRLLALAVLANLTFIVAATALAGCWAGWAWRNRRLAIEESRPQTLRWLWQGFGRPGAIVFACMALPLLTIRPGHFYFGAQNLSESLHSVVDASFAHHPQTWPLDTQADGFRRGLDVIALGIVPAALFAFAVVWLLLARKLWTSAAQTTGGRTEPGVWLFFLSAGSVTLILLELFALHNVARMRLPLERTALYFIPPFFFALMSFHAGLAALVSSKRAPAHESPGGFPRGATTAAALVLCAVWGTQFQTKTYRWWKLECESRQLFQLARSKHEPGSKQRLRVGATWSLAPALNFYRDVYASDYIERIERRDTYPDDVDVYVVAPGEWGGRPPSEPVVEFFRSTATGMSVSTPSARHALPVQGFEESEAK